MEYDKRQVQDTREYINDTDGNIVSVPYVLDAEYIIQNKKRSI
jgi:hypothetical protein